MGRTFERGIRIAAMGILVALLVGFFTSPHASAFPGDNNSSPAVAVTQPTAPVASSSSSCNAGDSRSNLLAINRWGDAVSQFHDRPHGGFLNTEAISTKVQREGIQGTAFTLGTFFWTTATQLTDFAARFCILNTVGAIADHDAAIIGNAIFNPGGKVPSLGVALLVIAFLLILWRNRRAEGSGLKALIRPVAFVAT